MSDENRNDELRRMLSDEVPEPGGLYWESIDTRLAHVSNERAVDVRAVRELERVSGGSDTDDQAIRLMDMPTPAIPTPTRPPRLLAAAAAVAVIAGVAGLVAWLDNQPRLLEAGNHDDTPTETQPVETTPPPAEITPPPAEIRASYRCFGPQFVSIEASEDVWVVQFKGEDFVSLQEFPDFEGVGSVISSGTVGADGSAEARSVAVPNGRRTTQTWFFNEDGLETSTETVGNEVECAGLENFDDLVSQLETEHAEVLGQEQALNIVDGEPGRIATQGVGIGLEQLPLTSLPGPDGVEVATIGDDLNNVRSTGRTATLNGLGYSEIAIPMGGISQTGWISDDQLRTETRTLADINDTQSGSGFGIIDELVGPGEDGLYKLIIEGVTFILSPDATVVDGGITTPGPIGDVGVSNLQSGTTIEFIVSPQFPAFGSITDLRVVGVSAG